MNKNQVTHNLSLTDEEIARQVKIPTGANGITIMGKHNIGNQQMISRAYQLLNPSGCTTLEIGFGNGRHFQEVVQQYQGIKLFGLELSETMLAECHKLNTALLESNQLQVHYGNVLDMPYGNHYFDRVCTINTVYYWGNVEQGLSEMHRVIKPGGKLLIAFRPKELVQDISYMKLGVAQLGFHLIELPELTAALEQAGFSSVISTRETDNTEFLDKDGKPFNLESVYVQAVKKP